MPNLKSLTSDLPFIPSLKAEILWRATTYIHLKPPIAMATITDAPDISSLSRKRTGSIADILNHQVSSNKRTTSDISKPEEASTSSVYIVLETRTGDMDGTSVHSVYSTLTDANNAVIAIGECGSFDISSDDF